MLGVGAAKLMCDRELNYNQEICGVAKGTFELLGSLCFPKNKASEVYFDIQCDSCNENSTLEILFYDNKADSFPMVNRDWRGRPKSCEQREQISKKICFDSNCKDGIPVRQPRLKTAIQVKEDETRQWYFVLADCQAKGPIKVQSYTIVSKEAIACDIFVAQQRKNAKTGITIGLIVAIVILTLVSIALFSVSFVFYKQTKIPELLSIDKSGYNEL